MRLSEGFSHIFVGGGAAIECPCQRPLSRINVAALFDRAQKFKIFRTNWPNCYEESSNGHQANASSKSMDMRKHFRQRHMEDSIVVQEEGPLPQCRLCGLFVRNANSRAHHGTSECQNKICRERREAYAS